MSHFKAFTAQFRKVRLGNSDCSGLWIFDRYKCMLTYALWSQIINFIYPSLFYFSIYLPWSSAAALQLCQCLWAVENKWASLSCCGSRLACRQEPRGPQLFQLVSVSPEWGTVHNRKVPAITPTSPSDLFWGKRLFAGDELRVTSREHPLPLCPAHPHKTLE